MFAGDGEEVRSVRSAPQGPSRRSRNHQMSDEFQSAVQSSYDNDLKDETRDKHREFTFAMETQVVKIGKSHKEARKGTPRWVRLDEDDQDDRNELTLFLAGPSDSERKQISTNGVKVNQLQEEVLLMISVLGLRFLMMGYSTKLWRAICLTSKKSSQLLWRLELYGKP
ncbi:PREDICTED: uncharacterized protein LOC106340183 [Brassica oleracea var. oleracea]|nr:PREDICTED: uncharacterized protein LOC106340183 [Brassica oleracea var. oleracea]